MNWAGIRNLSENTAAETPDPPWLMPGGTIPPAVATKEAFRRWCADPQTAHCFWSPCTGINPGLRVSSNNPCGSRVAVVADYDSDALIPEDQAGIDARIERACRKGATRPTAWCRTFSGKARAVWVLEKALAGEPPILHQKALERLVGKLGCKRLLPGYDPMAEGPGQYFELGRDWVVSPGEPPVPSRTVAACVFEAGAKLSLRGDQDAPEIPLADIAAEVERRWPGAWPGEFRFGARGPLFWLEDGIAREGAQVGDFGMICYSDRAGKGFVPWSEILGRDFTAVHEQAKVESLTENIWYDGTRYWIRIGGSLWRAHTREDAMLEIVDAGFATERQKGRRLSDAHRALLSIHRTRRIDGVLPFLFDRRTIVDYQGERFLNTSTRRPLMEAGGDGDPERWPFLHKFFHLLFDDRQREILFARLKRAWEPARIGPMELGQMLIVAGAPSSGKSLLGMYVCRRMMGGGADAGAYLVDGKPFNKQLCEVGVANIDDGVSGSTWSDHKRMCEMFKKHAANHEVPYRPMYHDTLILPWRPLMVMTCNADDWSLSILPSLDNNIRDKIIMLRSNPIPTGELFRDRTYNETSIDSDLPHFLDWLLAWVPPAWITEGADPRYGMNPYHHPSLVEASRASSPEHRFTEVLDLWAAQMRAIDANLTVWEGTATALVAEMGKIEELREVLRTYNPVRVGRILGTVAEYYAPIEGSRMLDGTRRYAIRIR